MPNYIQYSTSSLTGSLRKGTVALGVTTSSIVGPTSITKWYSGITPNSGKYVIYKTADAGDPDIFCPVNSFINFKSLKNLLPNLDPLVHFWKSSMISHTIIIGALNVCFRGWQTTIVTPIILFSLIFFHFKYHMGSC